MSVYIVKFLLPMLLGYTLYSGIARRWSLLRPSAESARPRWVFGTWTGLSVIGVVVTTLHMAYGASIEGAISLLPMAGLALMALLCIGAALSLGYSTTLEQARPAVLSEPFDSVSDLDSQVLLTETTSYALAHELSTDRVESFDDAADEDDFDMTLQIEDEVEAEVELDTPDTNTDLINELQAQIDAERQTREETERHLTITRKALHRLEEQPRTDAANQQTIAELESRLAENTYLVAATESRAERESFARIASDNKISTLEQDYARAQSDLRRNVEARAKALSTANKSIAMAREASKGRLRAETTIEELKLTLENRQQTISSLIKSLEKEKRRSQEEVSRRARELVLHERQLQSRRSLEEVSRSVEGNLRSKLVKKVARARPLMNDDLSA